MYDPEIQHRRSIRLRGYDYSQPGEYFVTLCTHEMQMLFGRVADGRMELNAYGRLTDEEWHRSEAIRPEIELDEWLVMPNHVHGIIRIVAGAHGHAPVDRKGIDAAGAHGDAPLRPGGAKRISRRRPRSLASFVGGLKSAVKLRVNELRGTPGADVWQKNYYEHVIRNPHELEIIRDYIRYNPLRWACDRHNPERGLLVQDAVGRLKNWMK